MIRTTDAIVLSALALLGLGVVMVQSARMSVGGPDPVAYESIVLSQTTLYAVLALGALWLATRVPIESWLTRSRGGSIIAWLFPLIVIVCLLVYVPGLGRNVKGSQRWVSFHEFGVPFGFQPSEVAKWCLPIALAWHLGRQRHRMDRFLVGALPAMLALGGVAGLIALEDLGTGVLIAAAGGVVLLAGGVRLRHVLPAAPVAALGLVLAVLMEPYRIRRVLSFLDPWAEADTSGYHMIQSMAAVSGGEGFGRGLGFGLQKFGYLPEDHNDFLFAVVCEELGIVGAALVFLLYLVIIWAGLRIMRQQRDLAVRLVCLGVVTTIGIQALINTVVVTGLGPTKGIALPLMSSGGTGWILTAASLGLLVGIERRRLARDIAAPTVETGEPDEWHADTRIITRPLRLRPQVAAQSAPGPDADESNIEVVTPGRKPLRTAG
ncbi:MAG: FtsW/RodA/SpoVE family cell cycle protein [Phycisphaeraceae bacterium]|nr:FtsW/RodA/SpoVE family cell cycle protein [Phycisphaeraceae bacterium]